MGGVSVIHRKDCTEGESRLSLDGEAVKRYERTWNRTTAGQRALLLSLVGNEQGDRYCYLEWGDLPPEVKWQYVDAMDLFLDYQARMLRSCMATQS